jgi:molecular chaperone GrpE
MLPSPSSHIAERNQAVGDCNKKVEALTAQMDSLQDKYMRLMADFDNYKRRGAKDNERIIEAANEELIKDIIEVRENFDRAFKSNDHGEKTFEGLKLNYARLSAILQKYGLEMYTAPGDEFDPEIHDAVLSASHELVPNSYIIDVVEQGYKLKGKIIKHSKVVVSSGRSEEKKEKLHNGKKR